VNNMNLGIEDVKKENDTESTEFVSGSEKQQGYINRLIFRESKSKKIIARTFVALIRSALIALSHLPIKKKERHPTEIKPSQINAHVQNPYRHKTFPIICLGDLTEQLRNKKS